MEINVSELVVRTAESTVAPVEVASATDRHVFSVDPYDCPEGKNKICSYSLDKHWTFQGNDSDVGAQWSKPIALSG